MMERPAKTPITVVGIATDVAPMVADFSATHATNPLFTPHARFHGVWRVLRQAGVAVFSLYLRWIASFGGHVLAAAVLDFNWALTFIITLFNMKRFGGALKDVNGIKPFRFRIGGRDRQVDTNVFGRSRRRASTASQASCC